MKKIKDYITKPSEVIHAMIEGLIQQDKREDFIVDMDDFGYYVGDTCFGCAATCATQYIFKKNIPLEKIFKVENRSEYLEVEVQDLDLFEAVVDNFRMGNPKHLFNYFDIPFTRDVGVELPDLDTHTWKKNIHRYKEYSEFLKTKGY